MLSLRWWPSTIRLWSRGPSTPRSSGPRRHSFNLRGEVLETRWLLSTVTPIWNDTSQLTLSFVPDGTDVGGAPSRLYETFNRVAPTHDWKEAILRALQSWVVHTRANVGLVGDEGLPLGTPGPRTQDPRFGDVRIAARPLATDVWAIGVAQNAIVGGTWSGDVIFNSAAPFASLDDLFAVALHEAGHVMGLSHSDNPRSPMYSHGLPPHTELTADDLQAIQQAQGSRLPDAHEGDLGNDTPLTAVELPFPRQTAGQLQPPIVVYADLTATGDLDYFALPTNHRGAGPLTVRVQSKEISLLAPRVRVLSRSGAEVASSASARPGGATLLVRIDELDQGERYYVEISSTRTDEFSVGAYSLIVNYEGLPQISSRHIDDVAVSRERELDQTQLQSLLTEPRYLYNLDLRQDDAAAGARQLAVRSEYAGSRRFEALASISDPSDVDYYRFDTLGLKAGDPLILNLTVHSLDPGGLIPGASVVSLAGQPVQAEVLVNGQGEFVIQSRLQPEQAYYLRVAAADPTTPFATGNYALMLGLVDTWVHLDTFVEAAIDPQHPLRAAALYVAYPQLIHLALETAVAAWPAPQQFVAQLRDAQDRVVARLAATPGETRTFPGLLLAPGQYTLLLHARTTADLPLTASTIRLRGTTFSDPFGVDPIDPTEDPVFQCPGAEDLFCYPGGIVSDDPLLWDDFVESLPDVPDLDLTELIDALLGDWWLWYWNQQGANGPALAVDDQYTLNTGETRAVDAVHGVLANDLDPDGDPLVALLDDDAHHGQLTLESDGSFTYIPDPGFVGVDHFRYLAYDFHTESRVTDVWLQVVGPVTPAGDFNGDQVVDAADLGLLCDAIQAGAASSQYDLNGDGEVTLDDLVVLVRDLLRTSIGDANLDGQFDSADMVAVFQVGQYETGVPDSASWSGGDWDCDGQFTSGDMVFAFAQGGYAVSASPAAPEAGSTRQVPFPPPAWVAAIDLDRHVRGRRRP